MKIILEHDEVLQLQEINRKPINCNLKDTTKIGLLVQAGLVKQTGPTGPMRLYITDLGKQVLNEHLPMTFPTIHYQSKKYYGN
jgi:hypothetical protein